MKRKDRSRGERENLVVLIGQLAFNEMLNRKRRTEHRVMADSIQPEFQLSSTFFDEFFFESTGDLFARQLRNADETIFQHQLFVQPIEMFVSTIDNAISGECRVNAVFHKRFQSAQFRPFVRFFHFTGEGWKRRIGHPIDPALTLIVLQQTNLIPLNTKSRFYPDFRVIFEFQFRTAEDVSVQPVFIEETSFGRCCRFIFGIGFQCLGEQTTMSEIEWRAIDENE